MSRTRCGSALRVPCKQGCQAVSEVQEVGAGGEGSAGVGDAGKGVKGRVLELARLGRKAKAIGSPKRHNGRRRLPRRPV